MKFEIKHRWNGTVLFQCELDTKREGTALEVGRELCPSASHMFFTSDAVALQWLKDRAYAPLEKPND